MKYEANIYQMEVECHTFWVAESKILKGCIGQGETSAEAIAELEINEDEWIEAAKELEIPIPDITAKAPFPHNGKISLRVAPNIHSEAIQYASELGISLNQYLNSAIIEYNCAMRNFLRKPIAAQNNLRKSEKVFTFPLEKVQSNSVICENNLEEM